MSRGFLGQNPRITEERSKKHGYCPRWEPNTGALVQNYKSRHVFCCYLRGSFGIILEAKDIAGKE